MDFVISFLIISIIIFLISSFKAERNGIRILQNIIEIVIYSFTMSLGIILAISLIAYALTEKIILGLTYDIIRVGVLVGGITLLLTELKNLYEKYDKKEK